jgi:hypothetical protein
MIVVIAIAFSVILGDLRAAVEPPIQNKKQEFDDIRAAVEDARQDFESVVSEVTELVEELQSFSIPNLIPNIPNFFTIPSLNIPDLTVPVPTISVQTCSVNIGVTISYPCGITIGSRNVTLTIPNIPSFNVPVPGLGALDDVLRDALSGITGIFDVFDEAFASIGQLAETLQTVPDSFNAISADMQALLDGLAGLVVRWGSTLTIVLLVLAGLVIIYFAVPILDDLRRGWRLLSGQPAD